MKCRGKNRGMGGAEDPPNQIKKLLNLMKQNIFQNNFHVGEQIHLKMECVGKISSTGTISNVMARSAGFFSFADGGGGGARKPPTTLRCSIFLSNPVGPSVRKLH